VIDGSGVAHEVHPRSVSLVFHHVVLQCKETRRQQRIFIFETLISVLQMLAGLRDKFCFSIKTNSTKIISARIK
jgi:hypothetical protein